MLFSNFAKSPTANNVPSVENAKSAGSPVSTGSTLWIPLPTVCQADPFHLATRQAVVRPVPIVVNVPPVYRLLVESNSTVLTVALTPPSRLDQAAPLNLATRQAVAA